MSTPLSALILGDIPPAEFRPVLDLIHRHVALGTRRSAADFRSSRQLIGSGWFPDLVIALHAWPDQFSVSDAGELISLCPLARVLCCFGPWCDSDGRTRAIWPLGVRVSAAGFASRFEHEVDFLANRREAGGPLPLTASRTEIFEFDFAHTPTRRESNQKFSVISPDRRFRDMLISAIKTAGPGLHDSKHRRPGRHDHLRCRSVGSRPGGGAGNNSRRASALAVGRLSRFSASARRNHVARWQAPMPSGSNCLR